jgi:hypothetical protein
MGGLPTVAKKRFADTQLYDHDWFLVLPPRLKCAWDWLCRRCDEIGIWNVSMKKMSFEVGEPITLDELKEHFKIVMIGDDKLFVPGFVAFQYCDDSGHLSPNNKFHLSIAKKLSANGLPVPPFKDPKSIDTDSTPIPHPSHTPSMGVGSTQGKGKGEGIGQGNNVLEGGMGEVSQTLKDKKGEAEYFRELQCLVDEWGRTLKHFSISKDPKLDEFPIAQLYARHGFEKTLLALIGQRFEESTKSFTPAKNLRISRIARHDLFEKFVNLGAQDQSPTSDDVAEKYKFLIEDEAL